MREKGQEAAEREGEGMRKGGQEAGNRVALCGREENNT